MLCGASSGGGGGGHLCGRQMGALISKWIGTILILYKPGFLRLPEGDEESKVMPKGPYLVGRAITWRECEGSGVRRNTSRFLPVLFSFQPV